MTFTSCKFARRWVRLAVTTLSLLTDFACDGHSTLAAKGIPQVAEQGLARVESHLDDVVRNQFPELSRADQLGFQAGERGMLDRLRSGGGMKQIKIGGQNPPQFWANTIDHVQISEDKGVLNGICSLHVDET